MANESLGMSFLKGLGALAAALVLFAGEQYIQHRYWPDKPSQQGQNFAGNQSQPPAAGDKQPQTPPDVLIPIDGRVIDTAGTRVIENASVDLAIGVMHENQSTDSDGRYAFSLEGFDPQTAASMTISAPGYKPLTANLLLSKMEEAKELKLEALPPPPGHGGLGAVVGAVYVGHAPAAGGQVKIPAQLAYVRRVDPKVIVAQH